MAMVGREMTVVEGCTPTALPASVLQSKRPLLLRHLVRDWPLTRAGRESPEAVVELLLGHYGGKPAPVYFGQRGGPRLAYNKDATELNFLSRRAPLDEVLLELLSLRGDPDPPVRYIASNNVEVYFPGLWDSHRLELDAVEGLKPEGILPGIWVGNRTLSPAHYDAQWNIACCAVGRRRVTVFPPEQVANLYPGPLDPTPGGPAITLVDIDRPDLERYPRFAEAAAAAEVAELEPGDAVFIPCMWWHQVEALEDFNVLLNVWWNPHPAFRGQAVEALFHALLSIRDRPPEEKAAWRALFDYYVFGADDRAGAHLAPAARGVLGEIDALAARQLRARLLNKLNR